MQLAGKITLKSLSEQISRLTENTQNSLLKIQKETDQRLNTIEDFVRDKNREIC